MSKLINIPNIGIVKITKKRGLKRMTLSIRPFKPVNITIPYSVSYNSAIAFIHEQEEWIIKTQKKISETKDKRTRFTPNTKFKTAEHELVFILSNKTKIHITNTQINVEYFSEEEFSTVEMQNYIRKGIIEALRFEAKKYLPQRTEYLANKHNFKFNKISVRNATTRWGSCSGKNNISLNVHLMRLPEHLIDYIILHELCHTVEKNHGKNFWALLDKVSGNAKALDKEVKQFNPSIF